MADAGSKAHTFADAHARLLHDKTLQFTLPQQEIIARDPPKPTPLPHWLQEIFKFIDNVLSGSAPAMKYVFIGCLVVLGAIVVWIVVREALAVAARRRDIRPRAKAAAVVFQPAPERAHALLADADRLAADGKYAEAARVLLHRSIDDLERFATLRIGAAETSREIAARQMLSAQGRKTFAILTNAVETAFFAGLGLDKSRYDDCRDAYRAFAFESGKA